MNKHFHFLFFSFQLLLASCSTTRHLPEGELLYTGTRAVEVTAASPSTLRDTAVAAAKVAFVAPPNNALLGSSRLRTPLPIGLWAYNAFVGDTTRLGRWLFRTFAAQPIYLSTVNPALRCRVAENTLHDYGYFNSRATHHIDTLALGGRDLDDAVARTLINSVKLLHLFGALPRKVYLRQQNRGGHFVRLARYQETVDKLFGRCGREERYDQQCLIDIGRYDV